MAQLVYALNVSLDGYVDHLKMGPPSPATFQHFIEQVRNAAGALYGRRMYEVMRYWDQALPAWDAGDHEYAAAWRRMPKWVVSRTLQSSEKEIGPNATLICGELEAAVRKLKAEHEGEIGVAGTQLAQSLTDLGLIDEYRLYFHPVVLGGGTPYFTAARPRLKLRANDVIAEDIVRLSYVPA